MQPRILVIENDLKVAQLIEIGLSCEGYWVSLAQDGIVGLIKARQGNFNLLILG